MSHQSSPLKVFFWAFPIVLIVCTVYTLLVYNLFEPHHGIFGDMFGGLNALFAALAFIGVILDIYQAQKQIQMQHWLTVELVCRLSFLDRTGSLS